MSGTLRRRRRQSGQISVHMPATAIRARFLAVAILLYSPGAALAEPPGQQTGAGGVACSNMDKLGTTQLRVTQQLAHALVEVVRAGNDGGTVEIEYGEEFHVGRLDQHNHARIEFALTEAKAEFAINVTDTPMVYCKVRSPDFGNIFRVTMRWHDPVQLHLNVIEPGGKTGDFGHVSPAHPNINGAGGIGQMDIVSGIPTEGSVSEISYVVREASLIPADAVFRYRTDYISRGAIPWPPHCDDHPLAVVHYDLIVLDRGSVTTYKLRTIRARCGAVGADDEQFSLARQ